MRDNEAAFDKPKQDFGKNGKTGCGYGTLQYQPGIVQRQTSDNRVPESASANKSGQRGSARAEA